MLKGIVNGVEKDITRIPMKGKNLFDMSFYEGKSGITVSGDKATGACSSFFAAKINIPSALAGKTLTISAYIKRTGSTSWVRVQTVDNGKYEIGTTVQGEGTTTLTFTATSTKQLYINYTGTGAESLEVSSIMLNLGSEPLPYEPYGYQEGWEIRDNQNRLIWGREDILEGTDSISFKGYGVPISTIEVDGNGQQNGTPTPDNPIIPEFCGDKTAQLWNEEGFSARAITSTHEHTNTNTYGTTLSTTIGKEVIITQSDYPTGTVGYQNGFFFIDVDFSKYEIGDKITLSFDYICNEVHSIEGQVSTTLYAGKNSNSIPVVLSSGKWSVSGRLTAVITVIANMNPYVEVRLCGNSITVKNIMINAGDTSLPYEPYGYKIPFTCSEQTVPVYPGEVPTVRKIYKMVLTGEENWGTSNSRFYLASLTPDYLRGANQVLALCSHYSSSPQVTSATNVPAGSISFSYATSQRLYCYDTSISTIDDFKAYLATQYANGTPVTVWYVLAEPETGIVNEPLHKIGDYYDTLTVTNQEVNIDIPEGPCLLTVDTTIPPSKLTIKAHVKSATNWNQFRNYIRNGYGPIMYPVGTILYDNFGTDTGIAYRVVAYDKHFDPSLTAQGYNHSVTLCEELLEDVYPFDNIEAMLYVETAIPAGTYKFTIPNYDATYGGNKTYYFTSTVDVPVDSQIVLKWDYQHLPQSVTAYAGPNPQTNTTPLTGFNGLTLTEWVEGESPDAIDLGTVGGPTTQLGTSNFGKMNHIQRARYGSNNYLQSGVRQYINSSTAANTWWQPQTIFDRPYSQRTQNGKLMKLNQDMVSVLAKPEIQSRTNNYFETTSLDGTTFTLGTNYTITTDKMFLLSPMEVGFTTTDTTVGTTLDYYIDATNDKRIKYRKSNNTAYYWWLLTPTPAGACGVRDVISSGALSYDRAYGSYGVAPACIIQ